MHYKLTRSVTKTDIVVNEQGQPSSLRNGWNVIEDQSVRTIDNEWRALLKGLESEGYASFAHHFLDLVWLDQEQARRIDILDLALFDLAANAIPDDIAFLIRMNLHNVHPSIVMTFKDPVIAWQCAGILNQAAVSKYTQLATIKNSKALDVITRLIAPSNLESAMLQIAHNQNTPNSALILLAYLPDYDRIDPLLESVILNEIIHNQNSNTTVAELVFSRISEADIASKTWNDNKKTLMEDAYQKILDCALDLDTIHDGQDLIFDIQTYLAKRTSTDQALLRRITNQIVSEDSFKSIKEINTTNWNLDKDERHIHVLEAIASNQNVNKEIINKLTYHALHCIYQIDHIPLMRIIASSDKTKPIDLYKLASINDELLRLRIKQNKNTTSDTIALLNGEQPATPVTIINEITTETDAANGASTLTTEQLLEAYGSAPRIFIQAWKAAINEHTVTPLLSLHQAFTESNNNKKTAGTYRNRRHAYFHNNGPLLSKDLPNLIAFAKQRNLPINQDLVAYADEHKKTGAISITVKGVRKYRLKMTAVQWVEELASTAEQSYVTDNVLAFLWEVIDQTWPSSNRGVRQKKQNAV